jgi:hypothetical protein
MKRLAKKKYKAALPTGWNSMAFCTSLRLIHEETPESDCLLWDGQTQEEILMLR